MDGSETEVGEEGSRFYGRGHEGVSEKLYHALSKPEVVPWYLAAHSKGVRRARESGGALEAAFYVPQLFGVDTYWSYLRRRSEDGLVRRPVQGFEMWLPLEDTGLSRELIWRGVHEPRSTALYGRLLTYLVERVDQVTVFEVGTNIGYFPLLALDALPGDATVHAVEPNPGVHRLLNWNLELNGYRHRLDVEEVALSDRDGTGQFHLSEATNWSQLGNPPSRYAGESIDVEVRTGDAYLRERGVDPDEVNVVRMDVQGHEINVLEGMPEVLAGESPLLLFVELHDEVRDADRLGEFVELLERNGIELEAGFAEAYFRTGTSVEGLDDLHEFPFEQWSAVQLFLRRGW